MTHRRTKLPFVPRIIAAGCVLVWLTGISACNLEALTCCASPGSETKAHSVHRNSENATDADACSNHAHDADAQHSPETDGHSHDSHKHDSKEGSCCSTLKAVVQTAKPVVFAKPAPQPISLLRVLMVTSAALPALSDNVPSRHPKNGDWVFTPEVCLGPAHRSLAPPAIRPI